MINRMVMVGNDTTVGRGGWRGRPTHNLLLEKLVFHIENDRIDQNNPPIVSL